MFTMMEPFTTAPASSFGTSSMNHQHQDPLLQDVVARLCNNDETLTEIALHGSKISAETSQQMANALSYNAFVKKLDLRYCFIEGGIKAFVKALHENTTVTSMSFQFCGVDDEDALELSHMLATNTTLLRLHVGVGCIMGKHGIRHICEGLAVNTNLQELDLSGSGIGDYGAFVLSMALEHNSHLQQLNLKRTLVSNVGAQRIAKTLETNTTLQSLDLSHTLVRVEGVEAMATMLERRNTTLKHVELSSSSARQAAARVHLYTSQNRAGRGLLQDPNTPASLAPKLLAKANDNPKALFALLRELPQFLMCNNNNNPVLVVA